MELTPEVEQALADLNEDDWHLLTLRVRPPAPGAQGRAEVQRRFGNTNATGQGTGSGGRAAAEARFGRKDQR